LPGQFCYTDIVLTVVKNSLRRYLWTFIPVTGLARLWVGLYEDIFIPASEISPLSSEISATRTS
jgi:hypothetical protein